MQKRRSIFLLLLCMALMCIPIQASAGSTTLTATVPEQPADTMEAPKGAETLGEVPLPAGWVWEKPDTELVPGDDLTATALYKDEDGKVLAERTIVLSTSKTPEATVTPKPTATPTPTATPEATVTPTPTVTPEPTATPTPTATPGPTITPEPTVTPEVTVTPETTVTPEATITPEATVTPEPTVTLEPTKTPDRKPSVTPKQETTSSDAVKTGDETNIGLWIAAAVIAAGVLAIVGSRLIRKRK